MDQKTIYKYKQPLHCPLILRYAAYTRPAQEAFDMGGRHLCRSVKQRRKESAGGTEQTIIFLGEATKETDIVFGSLKPATPFKEMKRNIPCENVLTQPWFTRVWVFQELIFSQNPWVQCGQLRVRWSTIHDAIKSST
ncbi:hypothetical protein LARI1_G007676 [Lachnellula arida]|uniref:Heterokaryon incompatibility domain-containing protein n=1 Tax=Lachnellula arida TaxID=1316785 RepID=A0A8T9B8V4_9HELO|nr:hypothetical protein LARI1_G007676 [Lachnellula arida]